MRNILSLLLLMISFTALSQDYALMESLNAIKTEEDAKATAQKMATQLKGNYVFYKLKEFDNGLLRIVYAPKGMTEDAIKAQADYEDCFVADFKTITNAEGKTYRFDKAKARYDALFPVWVHYFKQDSKPDKKTQRFTDTDKKMLFSFLSLGDVWAIGR